MFRTISNKPNTIQKTTILDLQEGEEGGGGWKSSLFNVGFEKPNQHCASRKSILLRCLQNFEMSDEILIFNEYRLGCIYL